MGLHAGFGGGGGATKSKKKGKGGGKNKSSNAAPSPLKPKKQWDNYTSDAFKNVGRVAVGVRLIADDDDNDDGSDNKDNSWMTVGYVKSVEGQHTSYALLRQRGLIAEHAKRLFPLKVRAGARLEWGYVVEEEDGDDTKMNWVAVSPKEFESLDAPKGEEKNIGFEGFCDTATGFYCQYHEGKLVSESVSAATSKYV